MTIFGEWISAHIFIRVKKVVFTWRSVCLIFVILTDGPIVRICSHDPYLSAHTQNTIYVHNFTCKCCWSFTIFIFHVFTLNFITADLVLHFFTWNIQSKGTLLTNCLALHILYLNKSLLSVLQVIASLDRFARRNKIFSLHFGGKLNLSRLLSYWDESFHVLPYRGSK